MNRSDGESRVAPVQMLTGEVCSRLGTSEQTPKTMSHTERTSRDVWVSSYFDSLLGPTGLRLLRKKRSDKRLASVRILEA